MEGIPSGFELDLYALINDNLTREDGPSEEHIAKTVYEVGVRLVEGQKANFTGTTSSPDALSNELEERHKPYWFRPDCQVKVTDASDWAPAKFNKKRDEYIVKNKFGDLTVHKSANIFKERKIPKKRKRAFTKI